MSYQSRLLFFPAGFPDESLFSLIARYHRLSGNYDARDTLHDLFNKHTHVVTSHLPSQLDVLVSVLPYALKLTAQDIIDRHTIFPYFRPFLTERQVALSLIAMRGNSGTGLKTLMGLIASQMGGGNCYRYCEQCAEFDIRVFGQAYWHRIHQLPAVQVCVEHNALLVELEASWVAQHRHSLFLPMETDVICHSRRAAISEQQKVRMLSLSVLSQQVLESGLVPIPAVTLRSTYCALASDLGLTQASGRIRITEFARRIQQETQSLSTRGALRSLQSGDAGWALSLLRKTRTSTHPLKHLVLLQCLNGSFEHLKMGSAGVRKNGALSTTHSPPTDVLDSGLTHSLREMLVESKYSLRRCAQLLNKSVTTLRVEAGRLGITIAKRPKKLYGATMAVLQEALQSTTPLNTLSKRHQISTVSLYRLLRMYPKVAEARKQRIFEHERSRRRKRFSLGYRNNLARSLPDYTWLYRHDKHWLNQAIDAVNHRTSPNSPRIDWEKRDHQFAEAVRLQSKVLYAQEKPVRVSKSSLGRTIGILSTLEKHLAKLPLTAAALETCVETTEQFQCRRIHWAIRQILAQQDSVPIWQLARKAGLKSPFSKEVLVLLASLDASGVVNEL